MDELHDIKSAQSGDAAQDQRVLCDVGAGCRISQRYLSENGI